MKCYNSFFDTLIPEFERLELNIGKARLWFTLNPFQIDLFLENYSKEVRQLWLNEVFSHDADIQEISQRTRSNSKEIATKLNEINGFFYRKTIFGLLKYCTESSSNWVDPVQRDNVYRFAWFHHVIANELDAAFHSWSKGETGKYVLCSIPPQHKIENSCPVFTTQGWKTHGELNTDDEVFGLDGKPKKVLLVHSKGDIDYELTLSTHEKIQADGNHIWVVQKRGVSKLVEMTTLEIKKHLETKKQALYIPTHVPNVQVEKDLAISPYLLGLWLGDGCSRYGKIWGAEGKHNFNSPMITTHSCYYVGTSPGRTARAYYLKGLAKELESLSLLKNKHIPIEYLTSSIRQRLELIAGLLDSDGSARRGGYSFKTTNKEIANGFMTLLNSLSIRYSYSQGVPTSGFGVKVIYTIEFGKTSSPYVIPCERLPRHENKYVDRRVAITRVNRLEIPSEGNCITVEDSLYQVGKGMNITHNCKSTLFAGGLIPMIMGNRPTSKGVLGTYNADFAATVLQKDTMATIDSEGYVKLFGKIFNKNLSSDEKRKFTLNGITPPTDSAQKKGTTKGGRIFAGSMKQLTGNPAQFILIDDPIPNAAVARSEDEVNKITQEYDASAMSRVRNNTLVAVIHTRWRDNDVIGYTERKIKKIIELEGQYDREIVNLCFRAFYDTTDDFDYDFRTKQDQMLWSEVSSSAYTNAKYSDDMTYHAVYQQRPLENLISVIKKEWIKVIPESEIPTKFEDVIISVDTSYNDKKTSDKAAFGVFGVTKDGCYYLLDLFYERCSFLDCVDKLDLMIQNNIDYTSLLIEVKANGQAVYETLEKKYSRIIPVDATESKKARVMGVSPVIQSGKLYLPDNLKGKSVLEQLIKFTGEGKHEKDDLVDITVQVIRWYDEQFKYKFNSCDVVSTRVSNGRNQDTSSLGIFKPDLSGQSLVSALKNRYNNVSSTHKNQNFSRICRL